jgi:hypothetical protein
MITLGRLRSPLHKPPPEDVGVAGVDTERHSHDHFEVVQFYSSAILVSVKAAHPALIEHLTLRIKAILLTTLATKHPNKLAI